MYYIVFLFLSLIAFLGYRWKINIYHLIFIVLLFSFFIGFRGSNIDKDYNNYLLGIHGVEGIKEFSFHIISLFSVNLFNSSTLVFLIYALLAVCFKFYAFHQLSNSFFLTLLIYYSTFFILQEMNAIRAGVAAGMFLMSIKPWSLNNKRSALIWILLASCFHYSFLILIPLLFIVKNSKKNLLVYMLLIPFAYLLYAILGDIVSKFLLTIDNPYIKEKVVMYVKNNSLTLDVFSIVFLIKCMLICLFYFFRNSLKEHNEYFYILFKFYCLSVFVLVMFSIASPIMAMRFYEIFLIVELILIPLLIYVFRPKEIVAFFIVIYCFFYLFLYVNIGVYLKPYHFVF